MGLGAGHLGGADVDRVVISVTLHDRLDDLMNKPMTLAGLDLDGHENIRRHVTVL